MANAHLNMTRDKNMIIGIFSIKKCRKQGVSLHLHLKSVVLCRDFYK